MRIAHNYYFVVFQGTLDVSKLYPSDAFLVSSNGCTLIMMAAMNNRTEVLKQLVKMENCPIDFKQMKVSRRLLAYSVRHSVCVWGGGGAAYLN